MKLKNPPQNWSPALNIIDDFGVNSFRISPNFTVLFQVDAAAEMYRETIQWRESFNLQQVMSDYGTGEVEWGDGLRSVMTQKLGIFPQKAR